MKSGNNKKSGHLTIGGLADTCDVGVSTVLYYQRIGLLPEPQKPKHGGFRVYDESHIERLWQIRNAQMYGFTLKEIESIFFHWENDDCQSVRSLITARITTIQKKVLVLKKSLKSLIKLVDCCDGACSDGDCPLFKKLRGKKNS
jgi:DNA-binding transcriptional MerR regulator